MQNGGMRWEANAASQKAQQNWKRVVDMSGPPAIVGNNVCAATYQGKVGFADIVNGTNR